MKKNNKKGFTLAELLIVVAIIGVLVAISIPIFTAQLEKAREATDLANIRSAYAEVMAAGLTEDSANTTKTVKLTQTSAGWTTSNPKCGNIDLSSKVTGLGDVTVTFNKTDNTVSISQAGASTGGTGTGTGTEGGN